MYANSFRFLEGFVYFCKVTKIFFQVIQIKAINKDFQSIEEDETEINIYIDNIDTMVITTPTSTYKSCLLITERNLKEMIISSDRYTKQRGVNKLRKLNTANLIKITDIRTLRKLNNSCVAIVPAELEIWLNCELGSKFIGNEITKFEFIRDVYSISTIGKKSPKNILFNHYNLTEKNLVHLNVPTLLANEDLLEKIFKYGINLQDLLENIIEKT